MFYFQIYCARTDCRLSRWHIGLYFIHSWSFCQFHLNCTLASRESSFYNLIYSIDIDDMSQTFTAVQWECSGQIFSTFFVVPWWLLSSWTCWSSVQTVWPSPKPDQVVSQPAISFPLHSTVTANHQKAKWISLFHISLSELVLSPSLCGSAPGQEVVSCVNRRHVKHKLWKRLRVRVSFKQVDAVEACRVSEQAHGSFSSLSGV